MRRIYVTAKVQDLANDYAKNVFAKKRRYFAQPKDNLLELRKNILSCVGMDISLQKKYVKYIDKIIANYETLLRLSPSSFEDYKNHVFNMLTDRELTDKGWCSAFPQKSFSACVVDALRYDAVRSEIIPYYRNLGIRTCVYCNTQYALTITDDSGDLRGGYELDHFKPKETYPFLAISFFNLQPCCGICNKSKSSNPALFNLYTDKKKDVIDPFRFRLQRASIVKYLLNQREDVLKIEFDSDDAVLRENHQDRFHIEELYQSFGDVVEELIWKSKTYNDTYIKQLTERFVKLFPYKKDDVIRFLYGYYDKNADIHKRPLTKLQQDIAKQILENK